MENMADTATFTCPGHQKTYPNISSSTPGQDYCMDQLESNRSFQEIIMDIEMHLGGGGIAAT